MADVTVITDMMKEEEARIKQFLETLGQKLKDKKVYSGLVIFVLLGFTLHQQCKGIMASFQLYWLRKTSGAPLALYQLAVT